MTYNSTSMVSLMNLYHLLKSATSRTSDDFNSSQIFGNWHNSVLHRNGTGNSTLDLYSLVIDHKDYYNAASRAKWMLSQPDRIIALLLGIMAVIANVISVIALSQVKSRLSSYTRLIMSLSVADIIIGLSVILLYVNKIFNPSYYPGVGPEIARLKSRCTFLCIKALNTTALTATLLNLMGMALDHYIAILKPLHYPILISNRRKNYMMIIIWTVSLLLGFSDFLSALNGYTQWKSTYNVCEYVWLTKYQDEYPLFIIAFICLITMMFFYTKIYCKIYRHQRSRSQLQTRNSADQQTNIQKNTKTLFTTLLILGSFIICWLPNCLFQIIILIRTHLDPDSVASMASTLFKIDQYLLNLLLLNSIFDPIIYSTRLKEVRNAFHLVCRKSCCCRQNENNVQNTSLRSFGGVRRQRFSSSDPKSSTMYTYPDNRNATQLSLL